MQDSRLRAGYAKFRAPMTAAGEIQTDGTVSALLPLSLLEAIRAHDRPGEILEDEDLTVSLPRRLGLTGVVETQMKRYEAARKSGRGVPIDEFLSLVKLVLKRPDASAILAETGRRMAESQQQRTASGYLKLLRTMPGGLLARSYRRAARRLLRQMGGRVTVSGRPPVVHIEANPISALEPAGTACAMYTAALETLGEAYAGTSVTASHSKCGASQGGACEWRVGGI